jgi:hypothetical protein
LDIDPTLVNLLVSYAANVGADATKWVAGKFSRRGDGDAQASVTALNLSIQAQLTASGVADRDAEKVAVFLLNTPILGYLFMLVDAGKSEDYKDLPGEEIRALLVLEAGLEDASATLASQVLVAVLQGGNQTSTPSVRRQSVTRSRPLSGIQLFGAQEAKRRIFSDIGSPSLSDIRAYSSSFRREMARKFSRIQLQHLDNGTEQLLEDLYVEPELLLQEPSPDQEPEVLPTDVFRVYARAVIQGPAGSGKSTTVRRLAADVAKWTDREVVPLVVELRKYSAQQALEPQVFLDHIRHSVTQLMQQAPPKSWLEYMLTTGRAVVFFDGLDEVLNAGTRAEVRDSVITFAQLFPASSIVVTSRYTGYDLAPLDKGEWTHIGVEELREDQVHEYASRWFELKDAGADTGDRAMSFIDESRTYANDLRSNPLMLSLLCSIYYARGDIPRTLHALYERCADMIYQQWNTMRGLEDHRAWDKDVRPVLYQVAHAVLSNDDYLSFGIPEEELVREVRRAFISNGAPDPEDASSRAREAVRLWAGRAWIITAVMTDEAGRLRYGFVHQSFLEYFAAVFEVRRVDTPAELYGNLRGRLIELNGWTVTQIAVSVIEAWKDHGGQRFLAVLLKDARDACDLDAFALLRLGISLVSIVPVRADQLQELVELGIRFVSRSVLLPQGDSAVYGAHEESRNNTRLFDAFDPEADEGTTSSDPDASRESVLLPTAKSTLVSNDIAETASNDDSLSLLIARATLKGLADPSDEVVAAALLQYALLSSRDCWPQALDMEAQTAFALRDHHWVVTWIAAQVAIVPIADAVRRVPWHALLLEQELLLVDELDIFGPEPFSPILADCLDDQSSYELLELMGACFSERLQSGQLLPTVTLEQVQKYFVFREPPSDWRRASDPQLWSDAFLVSFAIIGKLAGLAWNNGHALGELLDDSAPEVAVQLAAASLGWGKIDEQALASIAEPCRVAIESIISSTWPISN